MCARADAVDLRSLAESRNRGISRPGFRLDHRQRKSELAARPRRDSFNGGFPSRGKQDRQFLDINFGGFRSSDRDSRRGRGELRPAPTVRKEVNHMLKFYTWAQARLADEEGAAMAEYAVILALITAVVAGLFTTLGGQINGVLQEVIDAFN
jgi:Flp pilus assembly pilin Flp